MLSYFQKPMDNISQMNFSLDQVKECKEAYLENLPLYGKRMALIVSKEPSRPQLWIESAEGAHMLMDGQTAYIGEDALRFFN